MRFKKNSDLAKKQYENFITRNNRCQDKIAAGIFDKKKGRPLIDSSEGVRSIDIVLTATVECIYGLKDKVSVRILKPYFA